MKQARASQSKPEQEIVMRAIREMVESRRKKVLVLDHDWLLGVVEQAVGGENFGLEVQFGQGGLTFQVRADEGYEFDEEGLLFAISESENSTG